ncbi:MAG: sigma-54 dependent transcriptional regulator [Candidatus Thiodiazotropha weberae]|uniref:Fis family transcriptional regulator n=1 Tax=Candidatus Thiodiazotropha endoloripes TaxID=1818881 RepID=A0A1E2USE1_9GAMM|nr:sigma-54 dependent transcriptional regulator [Candidatus Thiodiazotropha endoloripes]MCG7897495.1 sigma-54 dependent transcriptional regulator [Candidatus Thiodiazotropha weberae]MCG7902079.1 sigma-54 dependent transcriptional regulator [Candidatus Thiodiazotropha weberae]MCG7914050.1 sigma-54 dependent transcriptional regulator [Candidatus Thiodiazotropha weberae]ODB89755.1 Fis family transcriptional regulator [Candidatus Thiodiazotropha endoloripes]ODB97394.1 Fis family transcriptional re
MNQILIVEDESVIRRAVKRLLERNDYVVVEAGSVEEARQLPLKNFDLIISDVRLPGAPGTEIIDIATPTPVLIMTSYASIRSAVDAMKLGAIDYIAKPFDHDELLMVVERVIKQDRQLRQQEVLKSEVEKSYPVRGMIGECSAMVDVFRRIDKVAPTDATVLILGESGTGKELVARALHERSHRSQSPFVVFNCAALPEHQVEAELFGQQDERQNGRSGLLAKAQGGTLFMDQVGELSMAAQARLLRVLQGDEYAPRQEGDQNSSDIRIIAATHQDVRKLVQQQSFRSDLYFRLRVVEMALPPLRERGNDIKALAKYLLNKSSKQLNRPALSMSRSALEAIRRYHWPGNVRELANTIERAVILCEGESITPELLAIDHHITSGQHKLENINDNLSLEEYFRHFVLDNQDHMTETELAKKLGISRKALWERRQRFGIPREKKGRKN